jgi:EAL domain-containing protein (putative c-di-GMP-specific phosphodiesterase class I)
VSPLRHKVTAVRTPVDSAPATVESLGRQLKEALALRRLQSISVWDAESNVQWLNEGALGPDEHTLVVEAFEQLTSDKSVMCHETGLEDGRYALFLPVRAPAGDAVGVVMVLADVRSMGEGAQERIATPTVRTIMQRLAVLMKPTGMSSGSMPSLAVLQLADEPRTPAASPTAPPKHSAAAPADTSASGISPQAVHDLLEFELVPEEAPPRTAPAPAPEAARPVAAPKEVLVLEFAPDPPVLHAAPGPTAAPVPTAAPTRSAPPVPAKQMPGVAPARSAAVSSRVSAAVQRARTPQPAPPAASAPPAATPAPSAPPAPPAPREQQPVPTSAATADSHLILEILQFGKLRPGGQSRRFQVQARVAHRDAHPVAAATDTLILQRLVSWLAAHRSGWSSQPTSFTVNLSISTLEDERFAQRMAATLNNNGLSPDVLGFEITEALCTQRRALVERFMIQCEKVGSWVVVDDFSFDSQVLPLLRSKAVRLVKLDHKLTTSALKDKLSQALVIATVQAVKVLGIHCAAKQIESQAALQWLTAIGCDFAQGSVLAHAQPLESLLARAPAPA